MTRATELKHICGECLHLQDGMGRPCEACGSVRVVLRAVAEGTIGRPINDLDEQIERARDILADAILEHRPVAIFAGFSGGHDSLVTTHFTLDRIAHATALHLNTGIGIEKTREFARATASDRGWAYHEERTAEDYGDMVLGRASGYPGGFPGPSMHPLMYQRLKERPVRRVMAEAKQGRPRRSTVMFVTGIRGDESKVRSGYKRAVSKVDSQVWVNPFYWATHDHFREYRERYSLPTNPVTLTLGFSGECLCGAFADTGELLRIRMVEPSTADRIEKLQSDADTLGFPWGYEDPGPPKWWSDSRKGQAFFDWHQAACGTAVGPDFRPLCHNCEKVKRVAAAS